MGPPAGSPGGGVAEGPREASGVGRLLWASASRQAAVCLGSPAWGQRRGGGGHPSDQNCEWMAAVEASAPPAVTCGAQGAPVAEVVARAGMGRAGSAGVGLWLSADRPEVAWPAEGAGNRDSWWRRAARRSDLQLAAQESRPWAWVRRQGPWRFSSGRRAVLGGPPPSCRPRAGAVFTAKTGSRTAAERTDWWFRRRGTHTAGPH